MEHVGVGRFGDAACAGTVTSPGTYQSARVTELTTIDRQHLLVRAVARFCIS